MRLSSTNGPLINKFTLEESIEIMHIAGFEAMDFYFNSSAEYYDEETDSLRFKERFCTLRKMAEEKGMVFNQAHAPFASSIGNEMKDEQRFWEIVRSMRNASYLGIDTIVVHPLIHINYAEKGAPEQLFELNMTFYNRLRRYCEEY